MLEEIVEDHGLVLLSAPGSAGVASVRVPEHQTAMALRRSLELDERVSFVGLDAVLSAAGKGKGKAISPTTTTDPAPTTTTTAPTTTTDVAPTTTTAPTASVAISPFNWHLQAMDDDESNRDLSAFVVAVLDSGVAYERDSDAKGSYIPAPSLSGSAIVAPIDLVNFDDHANDDHQHGTHIAGLIAGRSTQLRSAAASVGLMPVKVLDQNKLGSELALVEGILYATAHGADVINMSLSFHEGYIPSTLLLDAIATARDAGVVMVAAAGNEGANYESWPASHPDVIGVSALRPNGSGTGVDAASYGNRSPGVTVSAPGGDITVDRNGDGYPDGMVAESIALQDPSQVGLWMMSGTSQATALVSALAVQVLHAGVPPAQVGNTLQSTADETLAGDAIGNGYGRGLVIWRAARELARFDRADIPPARRYHASILPYLQPDEAGSVRPMARVTVLTNTGAPASDVTVYGAFRGATGGPASCVVPVGSMDGSCTLVGQATFTTLEDGSPAPLAWSVSAESVEVLDISYPLRPAIFYNPELDVLLGSLNQEGLGDHALALSWRTMVDPTLGALSEGYSLVHSRTGLATSPMGLRALSLYSSAGSGLATSPMGLKGSPVLLESGRVLGASTTGTPFGALIESGGWTSTSGLPLAPSLAASGLLDTQAIALSLSASGAGATPMPE